MAQNLLSEEPLGKLPTMALANRGSRRFFKCSTHPLAYCLNRWILLSYSVLQRSDSHGNLHYGNESWSAVDVTIKNYFGSARFFRAIIWLGGATPFDWAFSHLNYDKSPLFSDAFIAQFAYANIDLGCFVTAAMDWVNLVLLLPAPPLLILIPLLLRLL